MKIEWTRLAKTDYWANIEYLEDSWSEKEVVSFIKPVESAIILLESRTISFRKSDYRNVYKMIVIKQITLFYSIDSETLYLLRFWNNYQDSATFKLK